MNTFSKRHLLIAFGAGATAALILPKAVCVLLGASILTLTLSKILT